MPELHVGDPAPEFTLDSGRGEPVSLSDYRGKSAVVLFFYPRDETPVCTREACGFRDRFAEFRETGAEVIGISSDAAGSHQQFAERLGLPYRLLSDPGGRVRRLYGVKPTLGVLPGRTTFVIDRQGVVRHVYSSQFQALEHVEQALRALKEAGGGP